MRTMCELATRCGALDVLRLWMDEVVALARRLFPFTRDSRDEETITPRVATGALLLEVASADGDLSLGERRYIESVLCREFALEGAEAERLLRTASSIRLRAPEPWRFTAEMRGQLSHQQRRLFSRIIQGLAHVDGKPTPAQDLAVRRIASLLRVEAEHV